MNIINIIVFLLAAPFLSSNALAAPQGSFLKGTVVGTAGKPLQGVSVIADEAGKRKHKGFVRFEVKTEADGTFRFRGLYPGSEYNVSVEAAGQCNFPEMNILSMLSGKTQALDDPFILRFSAFRVSPDGIITDPRTGLQWAPDPGESVTWRQADQYAAGLKLGGGGWRLPTRAELKGLYDSAHHGCPVDYQTWNPNSGIDPAFRFKCCYAWSSEMRDAKTAWVFYFRNAGGGDAAYNIDSDSYNYGRVLAVRPQRTGE
ncbi:MAG: hypothetical protein C0402_11145 [Thermodesulfovibrio sp.]|nr:hypothetical protein [Thermodesulfovibrio sp.]